MFKVKYWVMAVIVLACCSTVKAQNELQFGLGYTVNVPSSASFKDMVNRPAYKGFTGSLAYSLNSQLSLGLSLGYNDYYQKYPRQVYQYGEGSNISAVISNSIQQMPLLITGNYTLTKSGFIRPYIGAGAGVNFISLDQYLGEFDDPHSMTKWALKGEAGIYIPLSSYSSTAIKIGGSYNFAPFNEYGINNLNNWGIEAGIRVPLH